MAAARSGWTPETDTVDPRTTRWSTRAEREALRAAVLSAPPRLTGARRIALALLDGLPPDLSLATRLGATTAAAWETWVDTGDVLAAGVYAELEALASRVPGCEPDLWLD